jgi:hypothetical protein
MSRSIVAFAVTLCVVAVWPLDSGEAQPPELPTVGRESPPTRYQLTPGGPVALPGQSLRQQYLELAEQRAGRMTDDELKQGIADMRRQFLIAQLKAFAESSPDSFDGTRVEIAIVALKSKDAQDIQRLVDSLPGRLEDALRSRTRAEQKTDETKPADQ